MKEVEFNKGWYSTAEASEYTSLGKRVLHSLVLKGEIKARYTAGNKKGGKYVFNKKDLDKYMMSLPVAKDF